MNISNQWSFNIAVYKVFAIRTESIETLVEADTIEEAIELADENYYDFYWSEVDGSMTVTVDEAIIQE